MTKKSQSISIRHKLSNLSRDINVAYEHVETEFLIERFLARITSNKSLNEHLIFKGGFVARKVYESHRYTSDLDALLVNSNVQSTINLIHVAAEKDLDDGTWFKFESQKDLVTQGDYGGIRLIFRSGIGDEPIDLKRSKIINFDIGIGDPVVILPKKIRTSSLVPGNDEIQWSVYPLETIIAEKLHALVSHGDYNSRAKDVYDLSIFLPKADISILNKSIEKCFSYRETSIPEDLPSFARNIDTTIMKKGWKNAMTSKKDDLSFDDAFDSIVRELSKLGRQKGSI